LDLSLLEEGRAHLLRYLRNGESGEEQQQASAKAAALFSALEKLHRAYLVHPKTDYRTLTNLGYCSPPASCGVCVRCVCVRESVLWYMRTCGGVCAVRGTY
jgi:hypothetical protein